MSESSAKLLCQLISAQRIAEINHWIKKYPHDQKQSAVMSALRIVQEEKGFLSSQMMDAVADYLDMPPISVYEVATFYSMYETRPIGRNLINICTNISCKLRGSSEVVHYIEDKLGIQMGQTTSDGRYTLRAVECLAACANAPMMQVNKDYHEDLTNQKIDEILEEYR